MDQPVPGCMCYRTWASRCHPPPRPYPASLLPVLPPPLSSPYFPLHPSLFCPPPTHCFPQPSHSWLRALAARSEELLPRCNSWEVSVVMWGLLVLGAGRAVGGGAGRGAAEPRGRGAVQGVASAGAGRGAAEPRGRGAAVQGVTSAAAGEQEVGEEEEEEEDEGAATATYIEAQREQRAASGAAHNATGGTACVRPQPAWAELGLSVAYGRMASAQPEHLARMLWCAATLGARVGGAAEEREGWDGGAAARAGRWYGAKGDSEAEDVEEGGEEEEEEEEGRAASRGRGETDPVSETEPSFYGGDNDVASGGGALAMPHYIDGRSGTRSDGSGSSGGPLVVPLYWLRRFFRQTAGRLDEFDALSFSSTLWALAKLKV